MSMKVEYFSAFLSERLEATDIYLPLVAPARADLLSLLPSAEDYIYLTIKGDVNMETVRCRNLSGTLCLDRGLEGTEAVLHHYGSCVVSVSPTVIAVVKDLICNYSCCGDEDCPCIKAAFAGAALPVGNVGRAWEGAIIFSGDLPMRIGISDAPSWINVSQQGNSIHMTGTPSFAGVFPISAAASNCNGTGLATRALTITINP